MSTYRYAVKVEPWGGRLIRAQCPACGDWLLSASPLVQSWARTHAASCEALHRANWAAYCPECDRFGRVAAACPLCLGEGWIPNTAAARRGLP